jgi:hypothetical protein
LLTQKNQQKYAKHLSDVESASPATIERKLQSLARFQAWYASTTLTLKISDNAANPLQNAPTTPITGSESALLDTTTMRVPETTHPHDVRVKTVDSRTPEKKLLGSELFGIRNFVVLAILILFIGTLGFFGYRQITRDRLKLAAAFPSTPVTPNRQLSFQGRLENSGGTPITAATNFVFKLFTASSGGSELYTSGTCSITPDADGVFNTQIGSTCGSAIASSVFTENANVWLEVTVGAETLSPRQQIATVAYALNAETLQGFPIAATVSAIKNTVVPMNQYGEILVGEQSPKLTGVSGTFQISAPALSITTATGTNGNITLAPDGTGQVNVNGNTTSTNFFNVSNAQLTTGSLITGTVGNNNTGYKLLDLLSGASPTSKFSVTDSGLTTVGADLYVNSGISLYGTAVSDGAVEAAKFCTGDGETNCVTDFSSLAGATYWTRTSGNLSPTNLNDTLSATTSAATALTLTQTGAFNALLVEDQASDPSPFVVDQNGNVGAGTTTPDAKIDSLATSGEQLRLTYTDGSVYTGFTVNSGGDLTIDATGGDVSLASGDNLNLTAATNLIFGGTTSLGETTGNTDSGAYLVGAYDEFSNSNSTNVQAVLKDLDTAITSAASGSWTLAGDSGSSQTISAGNTATFTGGAGITTTTSATDTITLAFAATELGNLTWGSGSGYTWTFDAGATDPTLAFASDTLTATAGTINLAGTVNLAGGSGSTGCTVDDVTGNLACTGTISGSGISASAVPFSGITSATNTTAAMVVGTGASLNYSGSGTINASTLLSGTWAIPGAIGATTPNAGTFTTFASNGNTTLGDATTDTITFTGRVAQDADLLPIGTTGTNDLGSASLPWDNVYGVALYQNGNAVCDSSGANCPSGSTGYWRSNLGTLSPVNDTFDMLVGGNATSSAKFAVLNINSGTPTASVSAGTAGAAYLTAAGQLATTAKQTLTLGNSTTGNVNFYNTSNVLDSSGNLKLVGHTATGSTAAVDGTIASWGNTFSNLGTFQDTLTSFTADNYTATLTDLTLNPSSDITNFISGEINHVYTNPTNTHTMASAYVSTNILKHDSSYALDQGMGGYYEVSSSTNKINETYGVTISTSGGTQNMGVNNTVTKDSTTPGSAIGISNTVQNTGATTTSSENTYGIRNTVTRQNGAGSSLNTYGEYISLVTDNGGAGTHTAYGTYVTLDGAADANYSGIYLGGNFGIGDATPVSLFTVGSGDTFQVDTNGDIVKIKNLTYSWPSSHAAGYLYDNGSGTLSWTSSVTASSMKWNGLTAPDGNLTLAMAATTTAFNWSNNTTSADQLTYTLTNTGGTAGTDNLMVLKNAVSNATTGDLNTESLLLLDQADTTTNGTTVLDNAILITNSGGATLTDAIHIGSGTQAIANGLNMGGSTGITTDLVLQNSETIDNNTDGTILLTAATTKVSADLQVVSSAYFANGTTYYVDNLGNAKFLDIIASDTGNPGLTVGNGTTGYAKVGGSIVYDAAGDLTLDSDSAKVIVADDFQVNGNDILDSAAATRVTLGATTTLTNTTTTLSGTTTLTASSLATIDTASSTTWDATTVTLGGNATVYGGAAASGTLTLASTSDATKGNIQFFSSSNTLDPSGNLIIAGDLRLNGNDILDSAGATRITTGATTTLTNTTTTLSGTTTLTASSLATLTASAALGITSTAVTFSPSAGTTETLAVGTATTLNLFDTQATTVNFAGAATTALNLGNGSGNYTAINLGSGAGTHTINIAGTGATAADTINIGTGGTAADTITIGNNASTTSLAFTSGTGAQTYTSSVTTGTTTTSAFVFNANALTSGTGMYLTSGTSSTSSTLLHLNPNQTSGNILNIAYGGARTLAAALTGLNLNVGTNVTATGFNVTGANITMPAVTNTGASSYAYKMLTNTAGAIVQNTAAGTTTWTGLDLNMPAITQTTGTVTSTGIKITGGTVTSGTAYAITTDTAAGYVGFGTSTPSVPLEVTSTVPWIMELDRTGDAYVDTVFSLGVSYSGANNDRLFIAPAGSVDGLSVSDDSRVGIGNMDPAYKLDVQDSQASSYVAQIYNTNTTNTADGLLINLGVANASRGTGNYFVGFAGAGTVAGKIQGGASAVAYTTTAADYAEYFLTDDLHNRPEAGDVVMLGQRQNSATKSVLGTPIGVVSTNPGFIGNGPICALDDDNCDTNHLVTNTLVGLVGQIDTKVSTQNGPIKVGDPLTSSAMPGVAVKATSAGPIIGHALADYSDINPNAITQIKVMVQPSWYDPDLTLTAQGDLPTIVASMATPTYSLRDQLGNTLDKIVTASTAILASVQAGLIDTQKLVAEKVSTPRLEVATITPLASASAVTIQGPVVIQGSELPSSAESPAPLLVVDGEIAAASVSARIAALESIQADSITARDIVADRITANHIEGLDAKLATLSAGLSEQEVATITDRIKARLDTLMGSGPTAADIPLPPEATSAATLQPDTYNLQPSSITSDSATISSVSAEILTVNNYLAVIGQATITSLDVTSHLYSDTLASKTGTLTLQADGGMIRLAHDTLIVDSNGSVMVNGDLTVAGRILAEQATVNTLEIGAPAEASGSALGKLLAVYNEQGESVATIDASGSANLAAVSTKLIAIAGAAEATTAASLDGTISSNATAGTALLPSGATEITITSPYVNGQTLVYLTPTTNTDNKVLFVKAKDTGRFTVAIDAPAGSDISFNWWVIALR